MNIKIELFKACIFMLIGAYLCKQFEPKLEPQSPKIEQSQKCVAIVKKVTAKDGTVTESTEIASESKQAVSPAKQSDSFNVFMGVESDKKATLDLSSGRLMVGVASDFKNDHVFSLKYKLLEF